MPCETFDRVYHNEGNPDVLAMLPDNCHSVLDIGCGAGDNARLLKSLRPSCCIAGVTYSHAEAEIARSYMDDCWVFDIEQALPEAMAGRNYDVIVLSHVLEHMRNPHEVLAKFAGFLRHGGVALIAVPNILVWRQRVQFLMGDFRYQSHGPMDDTHLKFMTFETVEQVLLKSATELTVEVKTVTGSVPLWFLRNWLLPASWRVAIDAWGCRNWPNLFGGQILLRLRNDAR